MSTYPHTALLVSALTINADVLDVRRFLGVSKSVEQSVML